MTINGEIGGTRWLLAAGLVLLIWGAKLGVIDRYGTDVPQTDQWHAEGTELLLPYLQGRLEGRAFIRPHNEHRIACTRALALALVIVNGQWDARLECAVNAGLHAALAVTAFFWGCALIDRRWHVAWLTVIVALTALPVAWENVVSGFHSQQYFLLWFSLGAMALLGTATVGTMQWWLGLGCAALAPLCMASGFLAALTIGVVLAASMRTRADWRTHRMTVVGCAVIVAVAALTHVLTPFADNLHARSPGDFAAALGRYLQWQYERLFWFRNEPMIVLLAPFQWLPWCWLGWRCWRRGMEADPRERVVVAAGLWTLLQFVASAYARGAGAPWVASRYVDTLVVGFGVNALALALLHAEARWLPSGRRRLLLGAAVAGFVCTMTGLGIHLVHFFQHELPRYHELVTRRTTGLQAYMQTGDRTVFEREDIPYLSAVDLAELIDRPEIRSILPASLQPALHPVAPWSAMARHSSRAGPAIAGSGLAFVALALLLTWRRSGQGSACRRS